MQRLYISNKDRIQGLSYDFLLSDVTANFSSGSSFIGKVVHVQVENFATTIIQGQNDTFSYKISNANAVQTWIVTVTFSPGVYPISGTNSLLERIQQVQDSIVGANRIQWNFNTTTKRVELVNQSQGVNWFIQIDKSIDPRFPFQDANSQLRMIDMLGLDNFVTPFTSTPGPHNFVNVASGIVDISASAYMDIAFNLSSSTLSTANLNRMIVSRVPIDVPYGEVVSFQENHPLEFLINTQQMNSLRITLYNQWNQFYVLPDNANLSIVIQLENID